MLINKIREASLLARDRLSPAEIAEKSRLVGEHLTGIDLFRQAGTVMYYVSFRSEVDTRAMIAASLDLGQRVLVPLTEKDPPGLRPFEIRNPARDLRPGYCSIPEPDPTRATPADPGGIDIVIVPGSVFDARGGRLGYGGGFYDRFLVSGAPQAIRIGLAFELQLADELPLKPHDQLVDYLVTEAKIRQFCRPE